MSQEYETLRDELLLLFQRAHDVWRWGLITIVTLLGAEIVALTAVYGQHRPPGEINDLARFLASYGTAVAITLYAFAGGIAVVVWQLYADVLSEMHRIGAYVAVFHDDGDHVPESARQLGWHVWNRVEKFSTNDLRIDPDIEHRPFHGRAIVYLWLLLVFIISSGGMLGALTAAVFSIVALAGAITLLAVGWRIWFIEKRTRQGSAMWNRRWAALSRTAPEQLGAFVAATGLRSEP